MCNKKIRVGEVNKSYCRFMFYMLMFHHMDGNGAFQFSVTYKDTPPLASICVLANLSFNSRIVVSIFERLLPCLVGINCSNESCWLLSCVNLMKFYLCVGVPVAAVKKLDGL